MASESSSTAVPDVQSRESDATGLVDLNDITGTAGNASGESLWVRKWDDTNNQLYYFNLRTQENTWEAPKSYKAVLMSEPLRMDTQRAEEAVEDPPQDEVKHSDATVTIQSLYRGRKDRMRVKEARKWTEQFDPTTGHKYYYNSETGESQWEKPVDFFTGLKDERSARAVKIQSVFRAKKDRDRVKQLADEEEEEEQLEQQLREEREAVAAAEEKLAALAAESSSRAQWCEYFDPRSGRYYYRHSVSNTITWEKPEEYVSSWVEGSKRDLAALSIQCAARKRIAANEVAAKRNKLRALTDPGTMQLKLGELKQVSVEIQAEIEARALVSREEEQQFPHLSSLITDWKESFESIKSHVVSLENRAEDILLAECLAARIVHAERFHKALSEMRSECLALLRSILLMNSYFVDLDVARINAAFRAFTNWKSHEVCALKDSRLLEFVQGTDVCELLEHVDALLHRAMGPTDFTNGATSAAGKRYEDWHPLVAAALAGVREMEESLVQKIQMLRGYRAAEVRKREISHMAEEDLLASRLVHIQRRHKNEGKDHAAMLIKCQECWKKGLNQRDEDLQTPGVENINKMRRRNEPGTLHIAPTSDSDPDNNSKLSIWEATKEGLSVEVVSVLLSEEREKARRLGYNFVVKTTRSDHGETLIQIACWWGHEHLMRFFLGEGAKVDCVDCTSNRFSLLHDAARRGHSNIIRILLEHGLLCNVTDSAGDTPLHWAARKNNFSAVLTLLGVYSPERDKARADEIIRTVRQKNLRGKTAASIAKGERVRSALKSAEEGRLPPLRRPRTGY
ncbi:Ankyrin repeats domain-containing protein [Phytophthora infestans]|uniref:Ankyrin repeats domain-containing protein n=1 Tax=Phytophthora infestans TaxID=4787 RepID=A0A8S9UGK6_PHYIN|nr:Ankyrin repeats domain-containing protein [Phytophthora infestans]